MNIKILLSGDGGQGIQTIAEVVCKAAFQKNWHVSYIPNYGLEQRGGVSLAFVQISDKEIAYAKFTSPNVLVVMSDQAYERTKKFNNVDARFQVSDYIGKLKDSKINTNSYNIFFLGLLAKYLEEKDVLKKEDIFVLLEKKLSKKTNWEENSLAFQTGTL